MKKAEIVTALNFANDALWHVSRRYLLPYYVKHGQMAVQCKGDGSQAVPIERRAEELLRKRIKEKYPEYGFICEDEELNDVREPMAPHWIFDPIDGTDLYVRRIPLWTTMLALISERRVILGLILDPISADVFHAFKGGGSFLNGSPLHVSKRRGFKNAFLMHSGLMPETFRSFSRYGVEAVFDSVGSERGFGDALGWMLIAKGQADIGLHYGLGIEDIAAPKIIIEEAGGKVTDWAGTDSISDRVLATNGYLHDEAVRILNLR